MRSKERNLFIYIAVMATIVICVYGCSSAPAKVSRINLRSEEDVLNETRANVERHLNDDGIVRAKPKEVNEPATIETPAKND